MPERERMQRAIESMMPWVASQRWFGDKSRALTGIRVERLADLAGTFDGAALMVARCSFDTGDDALYFMPSVVVDVPDTATVSLSDALVDGTFLGWWFDGFREERSFECGGTWCWTRYDRDSRVLDTVDSGNVRVMTVEQSNSSALFDNRLMVKIFRRLQPGTNPDLEVTRYLTTVAGYRHVPALYGVTQGQFDDMTYDLAVVQAFVPNQGDCWSWLGGQLRELTIESMPALVETIGLLGQRTGELHVALARETDDPAFVPEVIDAPYAELTLQRVRDELDETAGLLDARFPGDVSIESMVAGLRAQLVTADAMIGLVRTRVHGDYHLGQVLRTQDDDYAIIDFEGEPLRAIEYRREKASPLRDVAGMLRSLGYAAGSMRKASVDEAQSRLLTEWEHAARAAFIDRYRTAIAQTPAPIAPADPTTFIAALGVLELEKALYEARYEINNRPDWLDIPLGGLRDLATSARM